MLLAVLTVTTGLLGMSSRGLQLTDPDPPSEAVGPESSPHQNLQEEVKRDPVLESDVSDGSCGEATPSDAQHDLEKNMTTTPFNITEKEPADGRAGRLQVSR